MKVVRYFDKQAENNFRTLVPVPSEVPRPELKFTFHAQPTNDARKLGFFALGAAETSFFFG